MSTTEHPLWEDELMPYIDGQLQGESVARVAAHLASCADCRKAVEDTRKLSAQMSQWEIEPASVRMKDALLSELHRNDRSAKKWWNRQWVWGFGVGGAVTAAVLLLLVLNVQRREMDKSAALSSIEEPGTGVAQLRAQTQDDLGQAGQQGTIGLLQKESVD
ncbi:MAG TPA: zf-HC2 domain-containing protein, partial [Terriglobia bacterium]|nr:zf-HC2 domain-containing protein [Terriglobia bacterium]